MAEPAQAADEDMFLGQFRIPPEQTMGQGQTALWTLPLVATQYQPLQPAPKMQEALRAQDEGRFLDALILLDEAGKNGPAGADTMAEMDLLRASFLLQGNQSQEVLKILAPLLGNTQHAADAYALSAMAYLQQGQMQKALEATRHGLDSGGGMLPHLTMSYVLQGAGRLAEAREMMHGFNTPARQSAVALAREAELDLTLNQVQSAKTLVGQAGAIDAAQPYVIAVGGLVHLIGGQSAEAKAAFEKALKRDHKDAMALLGMGLAEIKLGNFEAGQKNLQAANEAEPGNALILTYLGRSQQQAGQTTEAMASWRSAQQADPKDPTPWLYQAQAELRANRLMEARESLRQAQERTAYRSVYRSANLLREDEQLLQANLAEIQRRSGLESLALHTLSDPVGEKTAANLKNQADLLQGRRFGESARRSLLLQSLFNEMPGNLPPVLDIYGDGAGQTGAATPQHGVVSGLSAQQASYNNYEELFSQPVKLEADAVSGNQNTHGEQIRFGVGNGTLGLGVAQRQYKTDGNAPFENLDNRIAQAIVQWRPTQSTQAFVSYQTFDSKHGETFFPADPMMMGIYAMIQDNSRVTRLGLRHNLTDNSELRGLWSQQQTDQTVDQEFISNTLPFSNMPPFFGPTLPFPQFSQSCSSEAHSVELQYRRSGAGYATQWGVQQARGQMIVASANLNISSLVQQLYMAWQQALNPHWQLDAGLGWGKIDRQDNIHTPTDNSTYLQRWLPKLGLVYTPDSATHVRLAAWQGMAAFSVGDAALAPASLAGIVLNRFDDNAHNGKLVRAVALNGDRQLSPAWLLAAQAQRRKTFEPTISNNTGQQDLTEQKIDESRLALHWQPESYQWAVSFSYDYERIQNDPLYLELDSVVGQSLHSQQLTMRWFAAAQCTANLTLSYNRVAGTQKSTDLNTFLPILLGYQDRFNQVDADLNWQFNRRGSLTAGVRNAADKRFQYADIDPLNPRFSNGRLVYAKLKLAW